MTKFHESPNIYPTDLCLKVKDLDKMIGYYSENLGFKIIRREQEMAVLGVGDKEILSLVRPDGVVDKPARRTGLYHFAILLPKRAHLGSFLGNLRNRNLPIQGGSHHGVSEAIYLQDPENNGIEVYSDVPDENWQWQEDRVHMVTEALDYTDLLDLAKDLEWKGMPEGTKLGHMHLHVRDLEESLEFYSLLGFRKVAEIKNSAYFISTGGYHHHMGLNVWNGIGAKPAPENATGMKFFTLSVPGRDQLEEIRKRLDKGKYEYDFADGTLKTEDPSANKIILKVGE